MTADREDHPMTAVPPTQPPAAPETDEVPTVHGLVLFEVYEASGSLLLVTSDSTLVDLGPGDFMVRRAWATSADITVVRRG